MVQRLGAELHSAGQAAGIGNGPLQQTLDVLVGERLQGQQQGPGQQRGDHGERRVLRGSGDQDHPAVLDPGQQGVLLGLVEAVDLIQEQHGGGLVQVPGGQGLVHDPADILDARGDGGQFNEFPARAAGDDVRQGGLARARRSPEDHRARTGRTGGVGPGGKLTQR